MNEEIIPSPQSQGGKSRSEKLSPSQKTAIAQRRAAVARWGGDLPRATHDGTLVIGNTVISCAVLSTRKRVLTQETILVAMGRAPKAKGGTGVFKSLDHDDLPFFLAAENLKSFVDDKLRESTTPIIYISMLGAKVIGFDAKFLPLVCDVYIRAGLAKVLTAPQIAIAEQCNRLVQGFAMRGIEALVDDATGFAEDRANDELSKILEAYVVPEFRPWIRHFRPEFFEQIYRIQGWEYKPGTAKRTPFVGKLINKYIYEQLPDGVLAELRRLNPVTETGRRRRKHFQFLTTDIGCDHLDKQILSVTMLLKAAEDKTEFEKLFDRVYPKQLSLPRPAKNSED